MKNQAYSSRTADKFVVRLPEGMRERLADVAREHHRSMNSEIISRLSASLEDGDPTEVDEECQPVRARTVSWCPGEGECVTHDDLGIGVIKRLLVREHKLFAEIQFTERQDIYELWPTTSVRPFVIEV